MHWDILKEFNMEIRHLENIWQSLQGTSYDSKKPLRRRVGPGHQLGDQRQFFTIPHNRLICMNMID